MITLNKNGEGKQYKDAEIENAISSFIENNYDYNVKNVSLYDNGDILVNFEEYMVNEDDEKIDRITDGLSEFIGQKINDVLICFWSISYSVG